MNSTDCPFSLFVSTEDPGAWQFLGFYDLYDVTTEVQRLKDEGKYVMVGTQTEV